MIKLKEHIVQILILVLGHFKLIELRRNIAFIDKVVRSDLAYMQVNEVVVIGVYFK